MEKTRALRVMVGFTSAAAMAALPLGCGPRAQAAYEDARKQYGGLAALPPREAGCGPRDQPAEADSARPSTGDPGVAPEPSAGGAPEITGALDKELIRQAIHSHREEIRRCYEEQLACFPKLQGKVVVKFVISAEGPVASSRIVESTVGNADLDRCVAGRVGTWTFPKPVGGGVVVVTYPFLFRQPQPKRPAEQPGVIEI